MAENFDVNQELKDLQKEWFTRDRREGLSNLPLPNDIKDYIKEFTIYKYVDGKYVQWDTRTDTKFTNKNFTEYWDAQIQQRIDESGTMTREEYEANKKYLYALRKYEEMLAYKEEGDIKTRGWGRNTYTDRVEADIRANRITEDGNTIFAANYDQELNELLTKVNELKLGSTYQQEDTQDLRDRIDAQIASNERPNRLVELSRQQQELDRENRERIGNRYGLTIEEKPVHKDNFPKSYELRNLLQIE